MQPQSLFVLALGLAPATAFVAQPAATRAMRPASVVSKPQMVLPDVQTLVDASTMLVAKSEADELLEDVFLNFPLVFGGGVFGYLVGEGVKPLLPDEQLAKVFVPVMAVAFVVGSQTGILGAASGLLAKVSFDAWNVFAGVALPGALLKY